MSKWICPSCNKSSCVGCEPDPWFEPRQPSMTNTQEGDAVAKRLREFAEGCRKFKVPDACPVSTQPTALVGSLPNVGDLRKAADVIATLARQLAEVREALRETSDALLTVAPLGGSECFRQVAGEHYADPFFLGQRIQELHNSRHEAMKRAIRAERQLAEVRGALQAMLDTHWKPRREEWLNDAAFEHAKSVDVKARAVLSQTATQGTTGD